MSDGSGGDSVHTCRSPVSNTQGVGCVLCVCTLVPEKEKILLIFKMFFMAKVELK